MNNIEAYVGTFFSKQWVQKNVLRLTDLEIEDMQKQINKESGMDPEDGGINLPDAHGGIRRDDTAAGKVGEPGPQKIAQYIIHKRFLQRKSNQRSKK